MNNHQDSAAATTKATLDGTSINTVVGNGNIDMTKSNLSTTKNEKSRVCSRVCQNYTFYTYQEIEARWLSPLAAPVLAPETMCWVLQSKGKRRRQNHTGDAEEKDAKQRKELLSRAWVVGNASPTDEAKDTPAATNCSSNSNKNQQPHYDRILVRYPKGSTYHVKRENLLPVLGPNQQRMVVVLPETNLYRRWAVVHTRPDDAFCEIGCDVGILVHRIAEQSSCPQHVWGLDKAHDDIATAQERYPNCHFCVWNVPLLSDQQEEQRDNKKLNDNSVDGENDENQKQQATANSLVSSSPPLPMELFPQPDNNQAHNHSNKEPLLNSSLVVAIDINGNRELDAVRQCIEIVIGAWGPRLIIVKSRALYADLLLDGCRNK